MAMSLKQSTLVLLTVAVLVVSGQEQVNLDDKEKKVDVAIGSSLTLHCKLETGAYERFRVQWEFLHSRSNRTQTIHEDLMEKSANMSNEKTHMIVNVTGKNSGQYHCKVTQEIPGLKIVESKKTEVLIPTPNPEKPVLNNWWMWTLLCLPILALFLLLLTCAALRRSRRRRAEHPIYANTRPVTKQPSPRPGASASNDLKVVPSSVNLRPPSPSRNSYDNGTQRYRT